MRNKNRAAVVALITAIASPQAFGCSDDPTRPAGEADAAVAIGGTSGSSETAGTAANGGGGKAAGSSAGGVSGAAGASGHDAGQPDDGDDDAGNSDEPAQPGEVSADGVGSAAGDKTKLTATISMQQVPAGGEAHTCVVVELPNSEPVWVHELHSSLSDGTHHLIVDRRPGDVEIQTQAESCSPTMAGDATRLMIAQQHETRVTLPTNVAYRLDAHQHVFLQLHFINLKDKPEDITGQVELLLADAKGGTPREAHSLFTGATNILLPPRESTTVTSFHSPGAPDQGKRHVFALTSHTHSLAVHSQIERVASLDAPTSKPLHESTNWAEPPLTQLATPLEWTGASQDGLRLTCKYMNTTDKAVHFGTAFHDEMCFMWLYYFDE